VDRLSVETDDMKQREGSDVSSSTASSMAVSTSSTDDMKTEPLRVVAPVVTDDMKTEENERSFTFFLNFYFIPFTTVYMIISIEHVLHHFM
jgi:hypothetical protein